MLLGLTATVAIVTYQISAQKRITALDFENHAQARLAALNADLQDAGNVVDTLRAFFEAHDHAITEEEFLRFSEAMRTRSHGLQDMGWAVHVTAAQREAYEQTVRAGGPPEFEIRQFDHEGRLGRVDDKPDYYPISYDNSPAALKKVFGFDLSSEHDRKAAIDAAIQTSRVAATVPLKMITVPGPQRGGVMSFAAVRGKQAGASNAVNGVVFSVFYTHSMISDVLSGPRQLTGMDAYFFDPAGQAGDRLIDWQPANSYSGPPPAEQTLREGPHWEGQVSIMDQQWGVLFRPSGASTAAILSRTSLALLAGGLFLTIMGAVYVDTAIRRSAEFEAVAASLSSTADFLGWRETPVGLEDHRSRVESGHRNLDFRVLISTVARFKEAAAEAVRLRAEQEQDAQTGQLEKRRAMTEIAQAFDHNVAGLVASVSEAASQLQGTAQRMAGIAKSSLQQSGSVAAASEQASANVRSVAAATEEVAAFISKVDGQARQSVCIAGQAVEQARRTDSDVRGLAKTAQEVGDVVQLIAGIASQTNLLALNATIEAARAGKAGAGFAVVASEVKALATQTAHATKAVHRKIKAMRDASTSAVSSIGSIEHTLQEMSAIAALIADAVEMQTSANGRIVQNVLDAASATSEVSGNIAEVKELTQATGQAAAGVLDAALGLGAQARSLRTEVARFIETVQAD